MNEDFKNFLNFIWSEDRKNKKYDRFMVDIK